MHWLHLWLLVVRFMACIYSILGTAVTLCMTRDMWSNFASWPRGVDCCIANLLRHWRRRPWQALADSRIVPDPFRFLSHDGSPAVRLLRRHQHLDVRIKTLTILIALQSTLRLFLRTLATVFVHYPPWY